MQTPEARRAYYLANRDQKLAEAKARYQSQAHNVKTRIKQKRAERLAWFRAWCLENQISCQCGQKDPACLDFHHKDPSQKLGQVPLMSGRGWSKERILQEVAKCVAVCANCHRKEHFATKPQRPKRAWLWDYKKQRGCSCGESHPPCLDFHHIDPTSKVNSVTKMVTAGLAKETVLAEIAKCELLCANCHRKHHA